MPMSIGTVETSHYRFPDDEPGLRLDCGAYLAPITLAYETYGRLNAAGDNAVLIAHGFTADAHAAGVDPKSGKVGWWSDMIGPGRAFDTDRYFVVASNVIGGCSGSTGPSSVDPKSGRPYACGFPMVTIRDMVEAQYRLLTALGVTTLATVSGASMGGHQALQWIVSYPGYVRSAIPIACSARLSAQNLAMSEVSRQAVLSDPDWRGGNYYGVSNPSRGLALARMAAHLTYISGRYLESEFDHRPIDDTGGYRYRIGGEFAVQEYLREEGERFVNRFDANSFLYLLQAMEYFDLTASGRTLVQAFADVRSAVLLLSFSSDWLFPVPQLAELADGLRGVGADVEHVTVETDHGHDAFLTDWLKISPIIADFLARQ